MYSATPLPVELIEPTEPINHGEFPSLDVNEGHTLPYVEPIFSDNHLAGNNFELDDALGPYHFSHSSIDSPNVDVFDSEIAIFDQLERGVHDESLELIVIDTNVDGYQKLVEHILSSANHRNFEFVYLNSDQNGFLALETYLANSCTFDAMHVISHGSDNQIQLGTHVLDNYNINEHAASIEGWSTGLSEGADILFYGCNVASTTEGQNLLKSISELTSADVAGSNDVTGFSNSGGNWQLEFSIGQIESSTLFGVTISRWDGTLEIIAFQEGSGGYASTVDTYIHEDTPGTIHGNETVVTATDNKFQTLIRFDEIFGNDPDQITFGSQINSARLAFTVNSPVAGSTITIYQVTTAWDETSTWTSLGNGVQIGTETTATALGSASGANATINFDVTSSMQDWADGNTNLGWLVVSDSSPLMQMESSESVSQANRPTLTVNFDPATSHQGLLLATSGNATASGTPGITSWTTGSVLKFADPNLQLGDNTNGTFSELIDLSAYAADSTTSLHGLHFVSHNMTLGNTDRIALHAGDIIFTSQTDETFIGSDGTAVKLNKADVGIFRPETAGDYSSGKFAVLLRQPNGSAQELRAITLVEHDTVVGDVTLKQGDILFSVRGAETHKIFWYQTNNVGDLKTSGSITELINGNDIGFGGFAVQGLELIEHATQVGDMTFSTGQIVIALQGNATVAGTTSVQAPDIFVINPTQTTAGSSTTVASAEMVFDGSDVNMSTFDEFAFAVAMIPEGVVAPSATNLSQVINYTEDATSVDLTNIVVTDPDANDTLTVTLSLDNPATGTLTALSGNGESYNSASGVWTVTGSQSTVNAALANVSFLPQTNNDANSTISISIRDHLGNGPDGSIALVAAGVNDAAVLTELGSGTLSFTEGAAAISIGSAISISDVDSTHIQTASVRIVSNYQVGQDELLFSNTASLTGNWNQATGTLTISGNATIAEYENALRSVSFINHSDAPNLTDRTIRYRVVDADAGASQSNTINRTLSVTATNDAPIAVTDVFGLDEDTTTNFTLANLLSNDGDPDGDSLSFVTITQPVNGTITHNGIAVTAMMAVPINATLVYTPDENFNGTDSATYRISDGSTTTAGTIQFAVAPVDDPPVAVDDFISSDNASAIDLTGTVLIGNDIDPDNQRLQVVISSQPIHGEVTLLNGKLHYIPDPEYAGVDTFTYRLNDGSFISNDATVTLTIDGITTGDSEPNSGDANPSEDTNQSETPSDDNEEDPSEQAQSTDNDQQDNSGDGDNGIGDVVTPNQPANTEDSDTADVISDQSTADASNGQASGFDEESEESSRLRVTNYQAILVGDQLRTTSSISTNLITAGLINAASQISENPQIQPNVLAASFFEQLDSVTTELKNDAFVQSGSVATVAGISGVLTVGYVLWMVRSGFLVASFVSTMPAWQMVDPLAVVEYSSSSIEEGDDDALEDMVQVEDDLEIESESTTREAGKAQV